MTKIKVLYCIDSLARGGTELQLIGLIDRLDRERFEPYILTLRNSPDEVRPKDCKHIFLPIPRILSRRWRFGLWEFVRYLRREKFEILHCFFPDSTLFGGFAGLLSKIPVRLAGFRDLGFWQTPRLNRALKWVYPTFRGFICNSQIVKDHFRQSFHLPSNRMQVIYNGIDVAALPWIEHKGSTTDIGIVGNMTRQVKRTDLFIKAAALLAPRYPAVKWHIVGDGHFRSEMESLARELGVLERIEFAGRIEDVPAYLARLQVGVLCSDSEGFSNALLEYMFKGCASVATDVGGNGETISHGMTGLLVPPNEEMALAEAMARYIEDVPFRQEVARSARDWAESRFGWDRCVAAHEEYYLKELRKHG